MESAKTRADKDEVTNLIKQVKTDLMHDKPNEQLDVPDIAIGIFDALRECIAPKISSNAETTNSAIFDWDYHSCQLTWCLKCNKRWHNNARDTNVNLKLHDDSGYEATTLLEAFELYEKPRLVNSNCIDAECTASAMGQRTTRADQPREPSTWP